MSKPGVAMTAALNAPASSVPSQSIHLRRCRSAFEIYKGRRCAELSDSTDEVTLQADFKALPLAERVALERFAREERLKRVENVKGGSENAQRTSNDATTFLRAEDVKRRERERPENVQRRVRENMQLERREAANAKAAAQQDGKRRRASANKGDDVSLNFVPEPSFPTVAPKCSEEQRLEQRRERTNALRTQTEERGMQVAAASMGGIDVLEFAKRITAPTLSFDWQAPSTFDDEDICEDGLEVELPPNVEVRGLLRHDLEKKITAARISQLLGGAGS